MKSTTKTIWNIKDHDCKLTNFHSVLGMKTLVIIEEEVTCHGDLGGRLHAWDRAVRVYRVLPRRWL